MAPGERVAGEGDGNFSFSYGEGEIQPSPFCAGIDMVFMSLLLSLTRCVRSSVGSNSIFLWSSSCSASTYLVNPYISPLVFLFCLKNIRHGCEIIHDYPFIVNYPI